MIGYPYPVDALIVSVQGPECTWEISKRGNVNVVQSAREWPAVVEEVKDDFLTRRGIDVGAVELVLEAAPVIGMRCTLNGGRIRQHDRKTVLVPVQAIPAFKPRPDPR